MGMKLFLVFLSGSRSQHKTHEHRLFGIEQTAVTPVATSITEMPAGVHIKLQPSMRTDHEISMLALHLIQNSMVYVIALMIQKVLRQPSWQGKPTPGDYAALTALIWEHINP